MPGVESVFLFAGMGCVVDWVVFIESGYVCPCVCEFNGCVSGVIGVYFRRVDGFRYRVVNCMGVATSVDM